VIYFGQYKLVDNWANMSLLRCSRQLLPHCSASSLLHPCSRKSDIFNTACDRFNPSKWL